MGKAVDTRCDSVGTGPGLIRGMAKFFFLKNISKIF